MRVSIDSTQAKGFCIQLQQYLEMLEGDMDVDEGTVRHVCGKLNWYCEVVQSGRVHTRMWWAYNKHGSHLREREALKDETRWWVRLTARWGQDEVQGNEYPILSASELREQPQKVYVVQSDASGIHGYGYLEGELNNDNPTYLSRSWGELDCFEQSHASELRALAYWIERTFVTDRVLVWVTDNQGSAYSVNKGRCKHDQLGMRWLKYILERCDELKLQIVALWVPREENEMADYLSHLSCYMSREEVTGKVLDLAAATEPGGAWPRQKEVQQCRATKGESVSRRAAYQWQGMFVCMC